LPFREKWKIKKTWRLFSMVKRYSHSKLSTFEQCPTKFKYRYIDKIPVEFEKTVEAFLGEIVHETLELLYTEI